MLSERALGSLASVRVGLITTINTNIGDDLIRLGVERVVQDIFEDNAEFVYLNKHNPLSVYISGHPARLAARLPIGKKTLSDGLGRIAAPFGTTRFDDCDIVIQCGGPVLWPDCRKSGWAQTLWYGVLARLRDKVPVVSLAAGSCYPWEHMPESLAGSADAAYIEQLGHVAHATTTRDCLARDLLSSIGVSSTLLPCAALLSAETIAEPAMSSGPILVSYMPGAGHYEWGQGICAEEWDDVVTNLVMRLEPRHEVVFLCHDERELIAVRRLMPTAVCRQPRSAREYSQVVAGAKAAVCNRLHACVALASSGIPSVAIGTDSRMLMVSELGLPTEFVKRCDASRIEGQIEDLLCRRTTERDRLANLRAVAQECYADVIVGAAFVGHP